MEQSFRLQEVTMSSAVALPEAAAEKAKIGSDKPHNLNNGEKTFESLVSEADRVWHDFTHREIVRCFESVSGVHSVLSHLYELHFAGKKSPERYMEFLKSRDAIPSKRALNEYHATVLAFIPLEDREKMKQRTSQYAQVLFVMGEQRVAPERALTWLAQPQPVRGKKVTGIAKALRLYERLPVVQERNKERRAQAQAERTRKFERVLKGLEKNPVAEVTSCHSLAIYRGQPLVLLARVEASGSLRILRIIANDNAVIQSITTRYLGRTD
jgi:hypothetical protein